MKKIFISWFICLLFFAVNFKAYSQAGSVELQDGGGVFISSHASIEEAYNAIPLSISQAYIIEILAAYTGANEVFPIDLRDRAGTSSANTITIRPDAGNTGEIISSGNSSGIINIHAADYIIIDGRPGGIGSSADLEIRNTATSGTNSNTIALDSGATHCVIRYCKSFNGTAGSTGPKNIEFGASPNDPSGNSSNLVEYCEISGGRSGVGSDGNSAATANDSNVVRGCSIVDWGFAGVWFLNSSKGLTVEDCTIYNTTGVNITNPSAINIQSTYDGYVLNIRRNKILGVVSTSTSATGLNVRGIHTVTAPGTGSLINIENNFIALNGNNNSVATQYGIYTTGATENYTVNIFYNTVLIGGTHTAGVSGRIVSAGIVKQSTATGIIYNERNNVFINNRTGGNAGVVHAGGGYNGVSGILNIDFNCYYSSTGSNHASWDSTHYTSLSSYRSAAFPNDQNARFKSVSFVSNTDLHLAAGSIGDPDLSARPVAAVTTDIDGDTRNASFPYKGADESTAFTLQTLDLTVNLEACSETDTIMVELRNAVAPYDLVEVSRGLGGQGITRQINFAKAIDGVNYYVVVKHRNSIETWSKSGGEVFTSGSLAYDFTSAASQAFGNNMVLVGSDYSFYTGDVQQDGTVDLSDIVLIFNDAALFITGYVVTDLNCDDFVDLTDIVFAYNNSSMFVSVIRP